MDVNQVVITGTIERDPFIKSAESGGLSASFTVRIDERSQSGAIFKVFVQCECFGHTADEAEHLRAGDAIMVSGKLKWSSYVTKSGEKKSTLAVLARVVKQLSQEETPPHV